MDTADLVIPESDWRKLLAACSGDGTLLYLYLRAGGDPSQAGTALRLSPSRMDCAAASLKQLGLWPETPRVLRPAEPPTYSEAEVIRQLRDIGLTHLIMLTGDNQQVADAVAKELDIDDPKGSLLPEEKVEAIKRLREEGQNVAMVGDGVNDAPAMAHSTVGIAMGAAGSDVALETADVALMADRLSTLPFAIELSRKTKTIIKQNLWISLGMVVVLIPATILGLNIGAAVLAHEGSTLVVVFNALRLLGYKPDF